MSSMGIWGGGRKRRGGWGLRLWGMGRWWGWRRLGLGRLLLGFRLGGWLI